MNSMHSELTGAGAPAAARSGATQATDRPVRTPWRTRLLLKWPWPGRGASADASADSSCGKVSAKDLAQRLHSSVIAFSVIGILAVGVSVALVGVGPLYATLRADQAQGLKFAAHTRSVAVREFFSRLEGIASQVGSRTQARNMLDAHARGDVELTKLVAFTDKVLADAAAGSPVLDGAVRTDVNEQIVGRAGDVMATTLWPPLPPRGELVAWYGPFASGGRELLMARTRINNTKGEFIGSDILLFRAAELRAIVEDRSGLGRSGKSLLLSTAADGVRLAFAPAPAPAPGAGPGPVGAEPAMASESSALMAALGAPNGATQDTPFLMAKAQVPHAPWLVAVAMDKEELYASINAQLVPIALVIAVLLVAGTGGMVLLLRPLAGKAVFHAGELEQQVAQKTVALALELEERKRVEVSLQAAAAAVASRTQALEAANRELEQFAYVTSHDLKAPLRAIANLSNWIAEDLGEGLEAGTRKHITTLRGRVMRMEALIDGILQYSRVGRVSADTEAVDVAELLSEVIDGLAPPDGFALEVGPGMPTLETARVGLHQVFSNLISNAIKYHDRTEGRVTVSALDRGDNYEFVVSDDGPGIDPEYHDKIFVIFQTLQARDKKESTGVGLTIVKKLVESQGGTITVQSALGAGAAFHFTWPKVARKEQ